jgi:hypothetical protein
MTREHTISILQEEVARGEIERLINGDSAGRLALYKYARTATMQALPKDKQ